MFISILALFIDSLYSVSVTIGFIVTILFSATSDSIHFVFLILQVVNSFSSHSAVFVVYVPQNLNSMRKGRTCNWPQTARSMFISLGKTTCENAN